MPKFKKFSRKHSDTNRFIAVSQKALQSDSMRPYKYCSEEECTERQELGQVSELEATLPTCRLPQSKRVLDPCIAVSKYRRSAAGGDDGRSVRTKQQLQRTLAHLIQICATLRSTEDHPPTDNMETLVNFVVDRLRACQSDATRLMSNPRTCVSSSWHAKVIRVLIWLRYACCGSAKADDATANNTARTIHHMRSTAYDAYWNTLDSQHGIHDDELLCYDAISRVCAAVKHSTTNYPTSLETSWNGMLLEFQKRRRPGKIYPLWNLTLKIASHARREEFYVLWKPDHPFSKELPVLAKSILSGEVMLLGRHRTVQHYNKSFGKAEVVSDMNRLLGIMESDVAGEDWSMEYANVFGIPAEENKAHQTNSSTIQMTLKQVAMSDFDSNGLDTAILSRIQKSEQQWTFGEDCHRADDSPMGMSAESIRALLEFGCGPRDQFDTPNDTSISSSDNPKSSLARALALTDASNGASCSISNTGTDSMEKSRARNQEKKHGGPRKRFDGNRKHSSNRMKKQTVCRFYSTSAGCKFGDKCKFEHTT